ncbi:MAG: hypothetical protein R3281_07960 [Balneolaceae bacterium]|nr:hypothetical protein [Balneolaceae bacterium]
MNSVYSRYGVVILIVGFLIQCTNDQTQESLEQSISQDTDGLHGYPGYSTPERPAEYGAGIGFYTAVWPLVEQTPANFQIGLPGTWIIPDNSGLEEIPLCPEGTIARTWEPRGPTWESVFQTIEGGLGYWQGNKYNYGSPKFSMNAVPNCYNSEIASPGWPFFYRNEALPAEKLGIAQLSNNILIPPDGITFKGSLENKFLGYSYMALPLTEAYEGPPPTGNQSWTLFLNASNFKGPVAYYLPEMWSRLSEEYTPIRGRGLDTRPGSMGGGGAMEINTVPSYKMFDADSTLYIKIPQLQFPVDNENRSVLVQNVTYYTRDALFNCMQSWREGGEVCDTDFKQQGSWTPPLKANTTNYRQGDYEITGIGGLFNTEIFPSNTFGFQWQKNDITPVGKFPQYFKRTGDQHIPVHVSEVPDALKEKKFPAASTDPEFKNWRYGNEVIEGHYQYDKRDPYYTPENGVWDNPGPSAGPFTASLEDGSTITYHWYKFIDQPAFQQFDWSQSKKENLQAFIENIHSEWTSDKEYMAPPVTGDLISIDEELIVTPPQGMEAGYVPIVTRQE